jgi:GH24 family phage-related lysozyme (muramidase)
MATIDELISSLALGQAQQQMIAQADPYIGGANIAEQIGNTAVQAGPQFSTRDRIIAGALSGLTSGLFTGLSNDYNARAQDAYTGAVNDAILGRVSEKPSVLSPQLFSTAKRQGGIFQLQRALQQNEIAQKLAAESQLQQLRGQQEIQTELAKEIIKNPTRANRAMSALGSLFGQPQGGQAQRAAPAPVGVDVDQSGMGLALGAPVESVEAPIEAELVKKGATSSVSPDSDPIAMYNRILNETGDESFARAQSEKAFETRAKQQQDTEKLMSERLIAANNSKQILNELDAAITGAGTTGSLIPKEDAIRSFNVGAAAAAGDPEAQQRQAARRVLNSLGIDFAGQVRKAFPGPVSEREFLKYLEASPGTDKTPEENKALADRMRRMMQAAEASNQFVQQRMEQGATLQQALADYSAFDAKNPLFVADPKTGQSLLNPTRVQGAALGSAAATPQGAVETPAADSLMQDVGELGGRFVRGVVKLPQNIAAVFSPSTYKQAFATPETAARTVGTGAAMIAGGATGAAVGAMGGPLAPVTVPIGAAIGSGLGYLGFGSAEEAASEAAGVGTDRPVVPTMKELGEAAEVAGGSFGMAGAAKAAQMAGKAASGVVKSVGNIADDAVTSAKQNLVGVDKAALQKSVKTGSAKYFDDSGAEVPVTNAATYQSKIEQALKVVDDDGLFALAKNDPKQMRVVFDKKLRASAQELNALRDQAGQALKDIHQGLPKIQQKQFPLTRDSLTGKGGFLPNKQDFSAVFDRIREIGKTDPQMVPALTKRANEVIARWNKSSRSFDALQDTKSLFGQSAKWGKASSATTDAWNLVKQDFNRVFADAQKTAFDFAMTQKNPALVGKLTEANAKFAAYKTLEPSMMKKGAAGAPPLRVGILDTPKSIIKRNPVPVLKAAEKASQAAALPSRAVDALTRQRGGLSYQAVDDAARAVGGGARFIAANPQILPGALRSSPQDDLTAALSQARGNIAPQLPTEAPTAMEEPAMPINPLVRQFEGGQQLKAYPPPARGSGVTVATGIDLGQRSAGELRNLGISESLLDKVKPYLGKRDDEARRALKTKPLELSEQEANELDTVISSQISRDISNLYAESTGQDLASLPEEARTVVESLAYNFGPALDKKIPTIWKAITKGDWAQVAERLRTTKWKQPELLSRRNQEADLLESMMG